MAIVLNLVLIRQQSQGVDVSNKVCAAAFNEAYRLLGSRFNPCLVLERDIEYQLHTCIPL